MNYDPIDTCPYDPVHRILRSRMQYHLTKCAKNWPCSKKKQCPYDARHIINQIEYNYHISVCPQRESVWRYKLVENKEIEQPKILPIETTAAAQAEENWEDDVKVKSYDPMKHTQNRPVTRILIGAPKSERKRHQKQERLRIARLEDELKVQKESAPKNNSNRRAPGSMKPTTTEEAFAEAEMEYKPLRRPKKLPLDTSKISDFSVTNNSTTVNQNQTITVNQDESLVQQQEKSNTKETLDTQPQTFSYAAATKKALPIQCQQNSSIDSDYDVVIESVKFDHEKENNSSFFNNAIDKVSKTVEELTIGDEGHKKQSESLDKTLESLKQTEKQNSNGISNNNNTSSTEKKLSRCAANFTNAKYLLSK